MHARVSTFEGSPDQIDAGEQAVREQIIPAARQISGFKGILFLGDRSSGKTIGVTFWESEEAMRESREQADRLRQEAADAEGASIRSVEEFEVVLDERS
jgi:heme-degrading monooxygenase HmoA